MDEIPKKKKRKSNIQEEYIPPRVAIATHNVFFSIVLFFCHQSNPFLLN